MSFNQSLSEKLKKREEQGLLRSLKTYDGLIDFFSNDYLGFAKKNFDITSNDVKHANGSTGSRLISGNSAFVESMEKEIANFLDAEAGLIFNSGYDANLGLFSCIADKEDTIIYDEYIHASVRDGIRLGKANAFSFKHNDCDDLLKKINHASGKIIVAAESAYSMDGDIAPLKQIVSICEKHSASLIVDEAHSIGVHGKKGQGLVHELGLQENVFARVSTFGKALGCHGAIVLGSDELRSYLINFARSFIYSTALPFHSLKTIQKAFEELKKSQQEKEQLFKNISHFHSVFNDVKGISKNQHPIQSVMVVGNKNTVDLANKIVDKGFAVKSILSPTVPKETERIRINLHVYNTFEEINALFAIISENIT